MREQLIDILMTIGGTVLSILGWYATQALRRYAASRGIELNEKRLERLNALLVNGMNLAATKAPMSGDKRAFIIKHALEYVAEHGAETLAALKAGDPAEPQTREALTARAETLISDPTEPTPAVLDGKRSERKTS